MERMELHEQKEVSPQQQHDSRDMRRMGLAPELKRRFTVITVLGFACTSGATWEYALVTSLAALTNGGTAGVIWIFLAAMVGMWMVILSLAEMASIAPNAGGQYHWASEFAPPSMQRNISYGVGWFTAIGWQASVASTALIIAQQTQALAAFMHPDFVTKGWITSLLMIAITIVATAVNVYGIRTLPWLESLMFMFHILGFFAILIPLWIMGERSPFNEVFTDFQDNAGWGSIGVACLVGLLGPVLTLVGGDNICHLAEETKDASKALPIAMSLTSAINFIIGFIMTITILVVSGNFSDDIATQTGQPYIAVLYAATQSRGATITFTILLIFMFGFCLINTITTTSRQLYAFARDGGLPFSARLAKVNPRSGLPMNALYTTCAITFLLSWIATGSTIAFQNIVSISLVGLLLSYGTTIATMLYRRGNGTPLPPSYLQYPKWLGYMINGLALCFVSLTFVFIFFPTAPHPNPASMNWSIVITAAVVIGAAVYYALRAKSTFEGPVVRIKRENDFEDAEGAVNRRDLKGFALS